MRFRTLIVFLFLAATVSVVSAQDLEPASVFKLGKFVVPKSAKGLEGNLVVEVAVDETGKVSVGSVMGPGDVCEQVTRPDVLAVRDAARFAALATTFRPAKSAGLPVASRASLQFSLDGANVSNRKRDKQTPAEEHYTAAESEGSNGAKTLSHGSTAKNLPKPSYPPAARAVRAQGAVGIRVLIDETGSVFSAAAVSGHPLLRAVTVAAACQAKFEPTLLGGEPVKVSGIITYNFVP